MSIKKELLEILACPACHGNITHNEERETLDCGKCRRQYPIREGIPVMLIEEATIPQEG